MSKKNILIIGIGYHARRIYVPHIMDNSGLFNNIIGFDLVSQKDVIIKYLNTKGYNNKIKMTYISDEIKNEFSILRRLLIDLIKKYDINIVIISTEPLYHEMYSKIILELDKNISILLDKPITLEKDIINKPELSDKIVKDYEYLCKKFIEKEKKYSGLQFDIMAQRRFHKGYRLVRDKIIEIFKKTNCPITYINSFHNDGQWRFPDEIIEQDYHPYNQGYGKLGHSGFHTIDIVNWFVKAISLNDKQLLEAEIVSFATFPKDLISQFNYLDYEKFYKGFLNKSKYSQEEFLEKSKHYGDIDSSSIIKFKNINGIQTIASINLGHNGLSQRSWLSVKGKDLYKGNGRIRQEFFMIEQGPFQSIFIETFQSKELKDKDSNIYSFGGEQHFDIHIFRNYKLLGGKAYEKISSYELYNDIGKGYSKGHNEQARRDGIDYFIENIDKKLNYNNSLSNILDHDFSIKIFSGIIKSIANQKHGLNPIIKVKL